MEQLTFTLCVNKANLLYKYIPIIFMFMPYMLMFVQFFFFIYVPNFFLIFMNIFFYFIYFYSYILNHSIKMERPFTFCENEFTFKYSFPELDLVYIIGIVIIYSYNMLIFKQNMMNERSINLYNDKISFFSCVFYYICTIGLLLLILYLYAYTNIYFMSCFFTWFIYIIIFILCSLFTEKIVFPYYYYYYYIK